MQMPPAGVGIVWFQDLIRYLNYTGIACDVIIRNNQKLKDMIEACQPNVFISMDESAV